MDWYALFVQTGQEELVKALITKYIDESTIKVMVPKRKIKERRQGRLYETSKIIFPGYVFLNTCMNIDLYYKLKQIPKYLHLLNNYQYNIDYKYDDIKTQDSQNSAFCPIKKDEIDLILRLVQSKEEIGFSKVYTENSKIMVCSGPLKGLEGIIKKIDKRKNRAKIALNFMGMIQTVDVGIEILTTPV
ncbi:antiterminator LoaP [Thermoflavimicrobium daqui]|jgi:transcriptional antiterminator NusG|uniref:Transcription antiterminator n=1 Tax=Thermoflavimicrobium daqui TaxID=2137476 RepID=A0A364K519_9BACL|nr:antiterminator LoaP [Thermoflavimicrobium daqui]RAL24452.1 transcription antiterminator [Thermoflavimicrobium daqui]